jgi:hypothetical protein
MTGKTVTEKRIDIELRKLDPKLCDLYDSYFGNANADDEVWRELMQAEQVLAERLAPRPLGVMEIRRATSSYTEHFRKACSAGRQRAGITTQNGGAKTG